MGHGGGRLKDNKFIEQNSVLDNANNKKEENKTEFQYLMNQMNKALQDSTNSGFHAEHPSPTFPTDERLNAARSQVI